MAAPPCDLAHNRFYAQRTTPPLPAGDSQHSQYFVAPFGHRRPGPSRRGDSCLLDGGMTDRGGDADGPPEPRRRVRRCPRPDVPSSAMLGPAFVAAVAYVDPGNVAANITAGARYGYLLVWVLALANMMSVLIQYQSAKLGIVTGKSLPQLLGERMGDAGRFLFFATGRGHRHRHRPGRTDRRSDRVAPVVRAASCSSGVASSARSPRCCCDSRADARIGCSNGSSSACCWVITLGFVAGLLVDPPDPDRGRAGTAATVHNHRLGAHCHVDAGRDGDAARNLSATRRLVNDHYADGRIRPDTRTLLHGSKIDVLWALLLAGTVNLSLLVLAAHSLHGNGRNRFDRRRATGNRGRARPGGRHDLLDWTSWRPR